MIVAYSVNLVFCFPSYFPANFPRSKPNLKFVHLLLFIHTLILYAPLQAILKSYVATSSDPAKPEKFLAYMAPSPDEVCAPTTRHLEHLVHPNLLASFYCFMHSCLQHHIHYFLNHSFFIVAGGKGYLWWECRHILFMGSGVPLGCMCQDFFLKIISSIILYFYLKMFSMSQQVRGDDADDPASYLVSFNKNDARYLVLHL